MIRKLIRTIFILLIAVNTVAQETQFNLLRSLPQQANAAFTGSSDQNRLVIGSSYIGYLQSFYNLSNYVGYDQYVKKLHGGLGVELNQMAYWNFKTRGTTRLMLNYAYHANLTDRLKLSAGIGAGMQHDYMNKSSLDPYASIVEDTTLNAVNFRWKTGFVLHSKNLYFGSQFVSGAKSDNEPNLRSRSFLTVFGGGVIRPFKNKELTFNPSFLYGYQDGFQSLQLQLVFSTRKFAIGVNSTSYSSIGILGAAYFKQFDLKYHYNMRTSPLGYQGIQDHEFIFTYHFKSLNNTRDKFFSLKLF